MPNLLKIRSRRMELLKQALTAALALKLDLEQVHWRSRETTRIGIISELDTYIHRFSRQLTDLEKEVDGACCTVTSSEAMFGSVVELLNLRDQVNELADSLAACVHHVKTQEL
jgi:hypothetical protein